MNNKIVWVAGSSAAGKETFIRKIVNNPSEKLIDSLGWKGLEIIPIEESMKYIGQFKDDPIVFKRENIVDKVIHIYEEKDNYVILIKYQSVDFRAGRLKLLKEKTSKSDHEILFLHAGFDIMLRRCKKKKWWKDEYGVIFKDWLVGHINNLNELKDFKITARDSSSDDYKLIKFPPKI